MTNLKQGEEPTLDSVIGLYTLQQAVSSTRIAMLILFRGQGRADTNR